MNNTMMTKKLIEDALEATQCIISVMGDHAGEGIDRIFKRKIEDITKINRTFWLVKSPKTKPMESATKPVRPCYRQTRFSGLCLGFQ